MIALEEGQARELSLPPLGYQPTVDSVHGDFRVVFVEDAENGGFIYMVPHPRRRPE